MKKFSALLLTGIIGTSMLFAGFSGSATLENKLVDLDDHSFGFTNLSKLEAEVELYANTAGAKGEGAIYAEINAKLTITIDETGAITLDPNEVSDASIVGDGWKVSILGPNGPIDYAEDNILGQGDDDDIFFNYEVVDSTVAGVAVTLNDLGTVSVGYLNETGDVTDTKGYVALEAAELEVAEGMKAQMGASVGIDKNSTEFTKFAVAGSAKVAYARDGYSASLAADLGYDGDVLGADVAMNSTMKFATVDAYYATENTNDDYLNTFKYEAAKNLLHVRVSTDLNQFDVPVALTLTGLDLVNSQDLSAKADVTINEELSAYVKGEYGIDSTKWLAGVGATYTVDAYTAKLNASFAKDNILAADASVESTTLIDGATLKLAWAGADDLLDKEVAKTNLGAITASCKIEF